MKRYVVLISIVASFGGLLFGLSTAVISGTINFIQPYFSLSETGLGWTVSSLLFGCIAGVLISGKAGDLFGRKKVLMVAAILFFISAIGSASAYTLLFFLVSRIIGGIAVGMVSIITPMYIAELAPSRYRGTLVSINQLAIVIGILGAFFSNYLLVDTGEDNWRWMLLVTAGPAVFMFICLFFIPETPRWLVARKEKKLALRVLKKTAGEEFALAELSEIEKSLQTQGKSTYRDLLTVKIRPILFIGVTLAILQQISGINAIMYYAPRIFAQIGQSDDVALLQTIAIGGINMVFTVVAMLFIDRFGAKTLVLIGSIGMTFMLGALSIIFFMEHTTGILVLSFLLGYIAFFAASLGPAIWVLVSEIFPNKLRSKGMSVSIVMLWTANIFVTIVFPVMLERLSGSITFMIFAFICLFTIFYVWRYVPETRGRTLEELEEELIK
jgi:MFS transporter, SP family, arabinose:H+ symporter